MTTKASVRKLSVVGDLRNRSVKNCAKGAGFRLVLAKQQAEQVLVRLHAATGIVWVVQTI